MQHLIITGNHDQLASRELASRGVTTVRQSNNGHKRIVEFDGDQLPRFGSAIKRGKIITEDNLGGALEGVQIFGMQDTKLASRIKKHYQIKRFKQVELFKADMEIKKKGVEIIELPGDQRGIITHRQPIDLYAQIDFDKPARGMEIGMMPSKLALILTNIAKGAVAAKDQHTIYDPFCGFGTTGFVANQLGDHFIGSDINITQAKQNLRRWQQTYPDLDTKFTLFKHDVTEAFTKPFLDQVDAIVTEGRLGPVVSPKTQDRQLLDHCKKILPVYQQFVTNRFAINSAPIVMTVPVYLKRSTSPDWMIEQWLRKTGIDFDTIEQPYHRPKQSVGRKVLLVKQN